MNRYRYNYFIVFYILLYIFFLHFCILFYPAASAQASSMVYFVGLSTVVNASLLYFDGGCAFLRGLLTVPVFGGVAGLGFAIGPCVSGGVMVKVTCLLGALLLIRKCGVVVCVCVSYLLFRGVLIAGCLLYVVQVPSLCCSCLVCADDTSFANACYSSGSRIEDWLEFRCSVVDSCVHCVTHLDIVFFPVF